MTIVPTSSSPETSPHHADKTSTGNRPTRSEAGSPTDEPSIPDFLALSKSPSEPAISEFHDSAARHSNKPSGRMDWII